MQLCALKLSGVRNLAPLTLEPGPGVNVLAGDNGQGKTNILEAIYTICALRSFRAQKLAELITIGETQAYLAARVRRDGLERVYELTLSPRGRSVKLDSKAARPIAKYFGNFNVILFAPEDLSVPRGSPSGRRKFLDRSVFNWSSGYLAVVQEYEKILKSRNALLKDAAAGKISGTQVGGMLDVYDAQLASAGARVRDQRFALCDVLAPRFAAAYEAITQAGLPAQVDYLRKEEGAPPEHDFESLRHALSSELAARRAQDRARTTTSVGPHRDDLAFRLAGQPAASFASQGQLRAMVLAWKTAEMDLLTEKTGVGPILLLDDVSSELDETRNRYLFEFLRARTNQCFITTTHRKHVLLGDNRRDYRIAGGRVETVESAS